MTNMFYFGHTYTWLYSLVGHKQCVWDEDLKYYGNV